VSLAAGIGLMIFFIALTTWAATDEDQRFLPFISAFPISVGLALLLIAGYLKKHD
jgi:peptidoglycan/LPS O-acetylase OafA/YrhL